MNVLIDETIKILKHEPLRDNFLFDFDELKQFIDIIVDYIIANLKENKLI